MSDSSTPAPQPAPQPAATPAPPSAETLKAAFKAFKKRLKLTQLDLDSKVGGGPMSGGQRSTVAGIAPPNQYPRVVWEALVDQKKLKYVGHGSYSLA